MSGFAGRAFYTARAMPVFVPAKFLIFIAYFSSAIGRNLRFRKSGMTVSGVLDAANKKPTEIRGFSLSHSSSSV
jgi:hypothetical protein